MSEDALFWTFSTVPQTLGGAVALLAAFALYRLQALRSARMAVAKDMRNRYKEKGVNLNRPFVKQDWADFVRQAKANLGKVKSYEEFLIGMFERLTTQERGLRPWLWSALLASFVCIVASLALLPFTESLALTDVGKWLVGGVLVLAAVCVVLYLLFIRRALAAPPTSSTTSTT